ncbi:MAG: vWA domain-containing protein [Polyangiales bacterium]
MSTVSGAAGAGLRDGQCARGDINATRIIPTVWLVIDGSGSMVEPFGDKQRWVALREALMDPTNGVVKQLENQVKFGLILYDGPLPGGLGGQLLPDGGIAMFSTPPASPDQCPRLIAVDANLTNFEPINMALPPDPLGGSTPTDKAVEAVLGHLPPGGQQMLDMVTQPTIVVLATDGEPNDFCSEDFFPQDPAPKVIAAVEKLAQNDVKTYVISLAGDNQNLTQHLTAVAAAGATGKPPFIPTSKDELVQIFKDISPPASCDIVLNGRVKPGTECTGTIEVNGTILKCGDPEGWVLTDERTVTLQGSACEGFKANLQSVLKADFPCEAIALN